MDAIWQTTFSWKKNFYFDLLLRVLLLKVSIGSDEGLVLNRQQAAIWSNVDPDLKYHMVNQCHYELIDRPDGPPWRFSPQNSNNTIRIDKFWNIYYQNELQSKQQTNMEFDI